MVLYFSHNKITDLVTMSELVSDGCCTFMKKKLQIPQLPLSIFHSLSLLQRSPSFKLQRFTPLSTRLKLKGEDQRSDLNRLTKQREKIEDFLIEKEDRKKSRRDEEFDARMSSKR